MGEVSEGRVSTNQHQRTDLLLSATGVGFSYRRPALVDFDLEVPSGCIVLLVGLNGAGKTTALSLLAGEKPASAGRIRLLGRDPRRPTARRHLFLLREEPAPPGHLTAAETVAFHLDLYGRPGPRRPIVAAALERTGLAEASRRRVSTFSKGMSRRLELGCLLAVDPEVWLLDEPQTGLDPLGQRLLRDLCTEARQRGRGLVLASHALADIPALADQVCFLSQGRTLFRGSTGDLMAQVGARGFVVEGASEGFEQALGELASRHGARVEGPDVPARPLEDYLFRSEGP